MWIIFLIIYLITSVIFGETFKIATNKMTKSATLTVVLEFTASMIAIITSVFFEYKFPKDIRIYIFLGLASIFYALNDRINTKVRKDMEVSNINIIKQLSTVFMIFAGFLFFKEKFVLSKFIGAFLIIISNIVIFYKRGEKKIDKTIALAILANICFAIALFLDVNISENFNLGLYIATTLGIPSLLIFLAERIKIKDIKEEIKNGNKPAILATAITWTLSIIAQLKAYQLGNVSVVAPLCSLTVILNVIFGYIILKERENILKKIIASILIIIGIVLIK